MALVPLAAEQAPTAHSRDTEKDWGPMVLKKSKAANVRQNTTAQNGGQRQQWRRPRRQLASLRGKDRILKRSLSTGRLLDSLKHAACEELQGARLPHRRSSKLA